MIRNHLSRRLPTAILVLCAALGIAFAPSCGKVNGPSKGVPMTLRAGGTGSSVNSMMAMGIMHGSGCDSIPVTYSQVLLVVRDVRFRLAETEPDDSMDVADDMDDLNAGSDNLVASLDGHGHGDGDGDDDHGDGEHHGDGDEQVVFKGPFVVDLLTHTADSLDTQLVQPGDYRSVKGHIAPLKTDDWNANDFTFLVGSTVFIQGTVTGDGGGAFTYQATIRHPFKIKGNFTVETATPATAFLVFDTTQWLCSSHGTFLDPRDPANDFAIRRAIIRSLKIGMDDNHDGRCNDRMHGE